MLCEELDSLFGDNDSTKTIKHQVDNGLRHLRKQIVQRGGFLFPVNYGKITPRQNNTRIIDYVSEEELAEVIIMVLDKCMGETKENLCKKAARAYNYKLMTDSISAAFERAFDLLLEENRIKVLDGKVLKVWEQERNKKKIKKFSSIFK